MSNRRGFLLLATLLLSTLAHPCRAQLISPPAYNPANGHWYQAVLVPGGITWPAARAAAATLSYAGYPGHLVTITSAAENLFLVLSLPLWLDDHWRIGGYQDPAAPDYSEPAGGWRWITGEPWGFTNWHWGEPNNYHGEENLLEMHSDGTWNDIASWYAGDSYGGRGFIVEYERPGSGTGLAVALTLFPNPVPGGILALGQVTLSQPAGVGGVVLTLSSSNSSAAVVPTTALVFPGATMATFPVTTLPVPAVTPVVITAASQGGTAAAILQVVPLPQAPPGGL